MYITYKSFLAIKHVCSQIITLITDFIPPNIHHQSLNITGEGYRVRMQAHMYAYGILKLIILDML